MTVALAGFWSFILGFALREIVRFWLTVWERYAAPATPRDRWGQVHVDADRRRPFERIG